MSNNSIVNVLNSVLNIKGCKRCTELVQSRTQVVLGTGDDMGLMIIGEAPGEQADKTGQPLTTSKSGKLIRKYVERYKIRRVFYTNVVKCRPPQNRRPTKDECYNCQEYLIWEIKTLNPKVIITLGQTASNTITNNVLIKHKINIMPIIRLKHPGYIMRTHNTTDYDKQFHKASELMKQSYMTLYSYFFKKQNGDQNANE